MIAASSASEDIEQPVRESRRRGCLFYLKRGLMGFGIVLVALILLGVAYQTIGTEQDKRTYAPRGQLYTVNGHQMHIVCKGEGRPAVILQAGGAAESTWWYWVQNQLAEHTRVCAYDRPGHGWSEPTTDPRNPAALASELHALLDEAGVAAPYVMAGHSFGAVWTRVYAAQYPEQVEGIVLVDSMILDKFDNRDDYNLWKVTNDAIHVVLWGMYRTGVWRLLATSGALDIGLPPDIAREASALQLPNAVFDADYVEQSGGMWALLQDSAAAEDLGDLPMMVLWASLSDTARELLAPNREEIADYSTNSATRYIEGANHGTLLGTERYARQVSDAILDVIQAAQTGQPLSK